VIMSAVDDSDQGIVHRMEMRNRNLLLW
jgi:hypothetical protein